MTKYTASYTIQASARVFYAKWCGMYLTRKIKLDPRPEYEAIRRSSGKLWSEIAVQFWRRVRRQGVWMCEYDISRWLCKTGRIGGIGSASMQQVARQFFKALAAWHSARKSNPELQPPHKQKKYNKVVWTSQAITLRNGKLKLTRGRGFDPIELEWDHPKPKHVELVYQNGQYVLCCQYKAQPKDRTKGDKLAGIDLGEIHIAAAYEGERSYLFNGRELRAKRQYQNKIKAALAQRIDRKQKGSTRWLRLVQSKQEQLAKIRNQINDILHKTSRKLVEMLLERRVSTLVIGDVRGIRNDLDYGKKVNQKLHQWAHGKFRRMVEYKAKLAGMQVHLINEAYTSQKCPSCGKCNKTSTRNYKCSCGFSGHRDAVGAANIRQKYLDEQGLKSSDEKRCSPVVGDMVSPTGVQYHSNARCSSLSRSKTSLEAAA